MSILSFYSGMDSLRFFPAAILLVAVCSLMAVSCAGEEGTSEPVSFHQEFTTPIEEAHKMDRWLEKGSIKTDMHVSFGGNTVIETTAYIQTSTGKIRMEVGDDIVAAFDGEDIWVTPADTALPRADFQVLTWPYFLALPYKLNDPGTVLEDTGTKQLGGKSYDTAKLTFEEGTGETPDDWYLIYRDPETGRIYAAAYVVTYGTSLEEANEEPHVIVYTDFQTVDGVPVSTGWEFREWSEEDGLSDQQIGEGTLSDISFVETGENFYEKPEAQTGE